MNINKYCKTICFFAILFAPLVACASLVDPNTQATITHTVRGEVAGITFSGKIVNSQTGKWMNDRLILLFLHEKEIARAVSATGQLEVDRFVETSRGESINGNIGVVDGLFALRADNPYKLTMDTLGVPPNQFDFVDSYDAGRNDWNKRHVIANWMDPYYEGEVREFFIPSKNIEYTVVSLIGPISDLPAEIQQPNSTELRDGNRLVAIDPNQANATPQPRSLLDGTVKLYDLQESVVPFDPIRFPLNNCGGSADLVQRYTKTYLHKIIDETKIKFGVEVPILSWLKAVAEVESRYGVEQDQVTTFDTVLTVPAGKRADYTIVRKQVWESGLADVPNGNDTISVAYRVLKQEDYEVSAPEMQSCP